VGNHAAVRATVAVAVLLLRRPVASRRGSYVITVTADAFSQIAEASKDDNFASINVAVRDNHVEPT
jgi:hypothetical protein